MNLKQKLLKKEVTIGSWITIGDSAIAEIMAKSGEDWLAIDMEHSALTIAQCQELIRVIDLCGITPLVRVGENNPLLIKRAMDAGASGVIVPMINSLQDAQKAVAAVKYPPLGSRGVGLSRAQGYGVSFKRYCEWLEKESIVIIQIEHIDAVENLEEIFCVKGVDAFIVGPYDLSGSLGVPGDFGAPKMEDALRKIRQIAERKKVCAGYHVVFPDSALVEKKIREGFTFIAYSVDFLLLGENLRQGLQRINKGVASIKKTSAKRKK